MRISDWSSDVCSSDLFDRLADHEAPGAIEIPVEMSYRPSARWSFGLHPQHYMLTHARFKTRFALVSYPNHRLRTATFVGTVSQADLAIGAGIARLGRWNTFLVPIAEIDYHLLNYWHLINE